ncbi:MAG: hypothetical protein KGH75_10475 [Rhodospirillales bacterium]|nr:hypothetical protein [Rhodospirillales bacterium]
MNLSKFLEWLHAQHIALDIVLLGSVIVSWLQPLALLGTVTLVWLRVYFLWVDRRRGVRVSDEP